MFDLSMLKNNTDNGLGTDRLSRHLVIFSQDVSALYFIFIEEKATNWRGVTWHRRRLSQRTLRGEVCTGKKVDQVGDISAISKAFSL